MDKNKIRQYMLIASVVFLVLSIAFFVFGATYAGGGFAKVLLFVAAVLVLLLAAELLYLWVLLREEKPNYFLFNPLINKNSSPEKLTFDEIDARMNKYLSAFAQSEGRIWTEGVFDKKRDDVEPQFYPAIAYKLLYDLAKFDNEAGWKCFVLCSDATVGFIAASIAKNGDTEMANMLRQLKSAQPINLKLVRDFLVGNKGYIRKKLNDYVTNNINAF